MADFEVHPIGTANRLKELETALAFVTPALPVLRDILARLSLNVGVQQVERMIAALPVAEAQLRSKR